MLVMFKCIFNNRFQNVVKETKDWLENNAEKKIHTENQLFRVNFQARRCTVDPRNTRN